LSRSKFHSKGERSIACILKVYYLNDKGVHAFENKYLIKILTPMKLDTRLPLSDFNARLNSRWRPIRLRRQFVLKFVDDLF
jgi:hypothetical protein